MHCRSTDTHCGVVRSSAASPGRRAPNIGANLHASRVGRVRGTFMAFHVSLARQELTRSYTVCIHRRMQYGGLWPAHWVCQCGQVG